MFEALEGAETEQWGFESLSHRLFITKYPLQPMPEQKGFRITDDFFYKNSPSLFVFRIIINKFVKNYKP